MQGGYVLARINDSDPGKLVTIANPDGTVIGLYRFDPATTLDMDALQTFDLRLPLHGRQGAVRARRRR